MARLTFSRLAIALALIANVEGAAGAGCRRPKPRSPERRAADMLRSAARIADVEVVREQDILPGQSALLRVVHAYKGPDTPIVMKPRDATDEVTTVGYNGFDGRLGTRHFMVLDASDRGYVTNNCRLVDAAVIRAIIRRTRR